MAANAALKALFHRTVVWRGVLDFGATGFEMYDPPAADVSTAVGPAIQRVEAAQHLVRGAEPSLRNHGRVGHSKDRAPRAYEPKVPDLPFQLVQQSSSTPTGYQACGSIGLRRGRASDVHRATMRLPIVS